MKTLIGSLALFVATLPACVMEEEATSAVAAAATKAGDEIHASQLSLYNGWPIAGLSGVAGNTSDAFHYSLEMANWAGDELTFQLLSDNGDADLYVRKWAVPDPVNGISDCASTQASTSNERCTFTSDMDGTSYYAIIDAFDSYNNATLVAYYTHVIGLSSPLIMGGGNLSRQSFRVEVPAGKSQLRVKTTAISGTNLPHIYVRYAALPLVPHSLAGGSFSPVYACKGTLSGNVNTCALNNPAAGTWYVMLEGVNSYSVSLEASVITRR